MNHETRRTSTAAEMPLAEPSSGPDAVTSVGPVVPLRSLPPDGVLAPGATVDRYTVLERLGAGGMGEVYAAYDAKLDRKIALKVLRFRNAELEARLVREAQAMARLAHPNVVKAYDVGTMGERLYLAMEFVRGTTLRAWQRERPRTTPELVRVYAEAGRGLAAAHAAGLVHRDFKPANVLLSEDGRVKVSDFGIARAVEAEVSAPLRPSRLPPSVPPGPAATSLTPPSITASSSASLDTTMTAAGTMVGTPGYMAPEQILCEPVDARTDQFAFSVSLYEALYGEKPFTGTDRSQRASARPPSFQQIAHATLLGQLPPPPKGTLVPAHVRRVLERGLQVSAQARYPSMLALLDDLTRDPRRKRRRVLAASAAALVASALLAWRAGEASQTALCSATQLEAGQAWNDELAERAHRGLLATGVPYAEDTFRRTRETLDAYVRRWSEMHLETCRATRVLHQQPEHVMALRMACLDERRNDVRALVSVFTMADRDVASNALQAAMGLPPVESCRDVAQLSAVVPEPHDPRARAELHEVRERLASVRANLGAGRAPAAREEAAQIVERAEKLGYAPVVSDALLLSARAKSRSGARREESIEEASLAALKADVGRADATRAEAATFLMEWLKDAGNCAEAERWGKVAEGALTRVTERGALTAEWLRVNARVLDAEGRYEDAVARGREALAVGASAGVSPEELAEIERTLATDEAALGHKASSEQILSSAEDRLVRAMGPDHPTRIRFMYTQGFIAGSGGDDRAALHHTRRAIALAERVAPDDDTLPGAYANACVYSNNVGEHKEALALCEKAIEANLRVFGGGGLNLAYAHTDTGEVMLRLRRYRDALAHYDKAMSIHEATGTQGDVDYPCALVGKGEAVLRLGDPAAAKELLERGLRLLLASPRSAEMDTYVAQARFVLAQAEWATGTRGPRIADLANAALEAYENLDRTTRAKEVAAWIAARSR